MSGQRLDGDAPIEAKVAGAIDDAHAAAADLTLQLVLAGECAGEAREFVVLGGRQRGGHVILSVE